MEYIFLVLAFVAAVVGLVGAVAPILPGPPISFAALLILLTCNGNEISTTQLVVAGTLAVVITFVDYLAPIWFTKKSGGSKAGTLGATVGLVLGLFAAPVGIVAGPFIGAFVGELMVDTPPAKALGIAGMTFVAFMLTTGLKLIYGIYLLILVSVEVFGIIFQ